MYRTLPLSHSPELAIDFDNAEYSRGSTEVI
jgi:hypothetical protein